MHVLAYHQSAGAARCSGALGLIWYFLWMTGYRILVVDDNQDSADSLAVLLRLMGNEVRTVYDGEEAFEVGEEFRPDVVLLDIAMPKLNGYETCLLIRQQPWGKAAFLISVTGWSRAEDRQRSEESGFDHHMVKPVDPASLLKSVTARPTTF